jgi:hypothetical protein
MILSKVAGPRLVTTRCSGSLTDEDHRLLAIWAARALVHSEVSLISSRAAGGHAMGAARHLTGAPRFAAYSAG